MIEKLKAGLMPIFSRPIWIGLAIVALLAAAAGPFGTYDLKNFWGLLFFWSLVIFISTVLGAVCKRIAQFFVGEMRPVLTDLILIALMTVLFTPVLYGMIIWLFEGSKEFGPRYWYLTCIVAVVSASVCALRRILPGFQVKSPSAQPISEGGPRLEDRLPETFHGPILRLTVDDHFVDVVTKMETYRLRMRLADAVAEMDPVLGYWTHRSHWVAASSIERVERDKGRIFLHLTNGDLIPVSRKYRSGLDAAGVL